MTRFDYGSGGVWCRVGRYWIGLVAAWPILSIIPVIAGGSDGMAAQGSYLLLEMAGSPLNMDEISEVTNISGGGGTAEQIDFTHLRSPGRRREFKPSFIDDGSLTFTVQYIVDDNTHKRILSLFESGDEVILREVFPDANGWDYNGFFLSVVKDGQTVGGKIVLNCNFKITGAVDFTGLGSP